MLLPKSKKDMSLMARNGSLILMSVFDNLAAKVYYMVICIAAWVTTCTLSSHENP